MSKRRGKKPKPAETVRDAARKPGPFPRSAWSALAVLAALHLWAGLSFIGSAAPTYDEAVHLASGYSYWKPGPYRLNISDHPPLAEMVAAVPLLPMGPSLSRSHPDWLKLRRYPYADHFLYRNKVAAERMLDSGRIFLFLVISVLVLGAACLWALRLGGPWAAVGAAAGIVFCPVLTSNSALVTTDGLAGALFFTVFWLLSRRDRSRTVWAAAGACAGLAMASKFSMAVIAPFALGFLMVEHGMRPREKRGAFPWTGVGLAALAAVAALAAAYRFYQFPLFWEGLTATMRRLGQGRSSFLLGEYATQGFFLYFPIALAVKTPIPLLVGAAATAAVWAYRRERERLWVILPPAAYFILALTSRTQIGVRHLLPVMPFLAVLAGCGAARLWAAGTRGRAVAAVMALWLAASVLRVHPHYLAYFNEAAGGPASGYKWLVDSNLDWGQDLKTLGRALHEMGDPPIYLSYFGTADPAAYGIRHVPVIRNWNVPRPGDEVDPAASGRVLLAVSATNLQANYISDRTVFAWLKEREPLRVFGHSIFLFDLTDDREGRRRLADILARRQEPRYPVLVRTLLLE